MNGWMSGQSKIVNQNEEVYIFFKTFLIL